MAKSSERAKTRDRSRSPMRLEEVIKMTDDTALELCTVACQKELRDLWDSMSGKRQGEKELARRVVLLKYQLPIVESYGFEASEAGVSKSFLESMKFMTKVPLDPEIAFKGQIFLWIVDPTLQKCDAGDPILTTVGLTSEFVELANELRVDGNLSSSVFKLRRYGERALGRISLSAPLCGISDARLALKIRSIPLPWAAELEDRFPVVCAVVEGVLSPSEVEDLREWGEQRGNWEAHQGHMRLKITDAILAVKIWKRLQHLLPDAFGNSRVAGLNEHIRFLKYQPGQHFLPHTDGQTTSMRYGVSRRSLLSAILYLSEPASNDSGGGTRFISPECNINKMHGRCDYHCDKCIDAPVKKGSLLLFAQSLVHAGTEPKFGEKYAMRSDVMYYS